jgi:hypothetical protein
MVPVCLPVWVVKAAPELDTTATVSVSTTAPALTFTVASRTVVLLQGRRQAPKQDMECLLATKGSSRRGGGLRCWVDTTHCSLPHT